MSTIEIDGWEDYTIDDKGNVFSKRRNKYLKQTVDKYGYCRVNLQKDKKYKVITIHRLVAQAFISNPNNYKCVNHIDGNKQNNCVENLEWCTYKHNMQEAYRLGLIKGGLKDKFGKDYPKKINIIGMYKDGILLEKFYGTGEIKRKYNYVPVAILDCCKGKYKKMYGYEWRFINEQV